jgi:formylglycine-generating enzyme required for sulfatase activity
MRLWGAVIFAASLALPAWGQQPTAVKDCPTCPELLRVSLGSFVMGAPAGEEEREEVPPPFRGQAVPQHQVNIGYTFWMGRYPVTRDEFAAFVAATGHNASGSCWGLGSDGTWQEFQGSDWRNPGFAQAGNHPVVCVSWQDAIAYLDWLGRTTGKTYRLPSEAEWEYVARAGTPTARFWGDGRAGACRYANTADETFRTSLNFPIAPGRYFGCSDGHVYTSPVGSFASNPWGFHDMLGNVWQWTSDCWHPNYKETPATGLPWGASGDGVCDQRVGRGGSWYSIFPWRVRAASRVRYTLDNRDSNLGFRVARTE